jgi:hypothetical protein
MSPPNNRRAFLLRAVQKYTETESGEAKSRLSVKVFDGSDHPEQGARAAF